MHGEKIGVFTCRKQDTVIELGKKNKKGGRGGKCLEALPPAFFKGTLQGHAQYRLEQSASSIICSAEFSEVFRGIRCT